MSANVMPVGDPSRVPIPGPECVPKPVAVCKVVPSPSRIVSEGKFLWAGQEKLYVRGVTYGTFPPGLGGHAFPSSKMVAQDFSLMSANGVNTVRTYTATPRWLL